jgi:hypothetical protein
VSLRHIPLTPKDQEWHAIFFGLNAHCDPDDTGAIFIERNFSVANRKERRSVAAGTRSKGPAKKAVIPRDYTIEIADEIHEAWRSGFRSMPTKPEVDAQIEDLYQSHVAVPVAGQAAVSLTNDPDGLMTPVLVTINPEDKKIKVVALSTPERLAFTLDYFDKRGKPLIPDCREAGFIIRLAEEIKRAWDRGDRTMPSQARIMASIKHMIKKTRSEPEGLVTMVMRQHEDDPSDDGSVPLVINYEIEKRRITISPILTAEMNAKITEFMDGASIDTVHDLEEEPQGFWQTVH